MTVSVKHSINLVTDFDETHPTAQRFLNSVPAEIQEKVLVDIFLGILNEEKIFEKMNERGHWAIVRVAD